MKKTAIIGIAIAIIVAGGLGIYAVSNTQEGPSGDESSVGFGDEATATVIEDLSEEESLDFEDEAATTVEEDLGEEPGESMGFGDSASVTVENP